MVNAIIIKKKPVLCQNSVCQPFKSKAITLFLYLFLFLGYTLKCNYCGTTVGWEECRKNRTKICRFPTDHCRTVYMKAILGNEVTTQMFIKDCADSSECNKTNFCNAAREPPSVEKIIKCEVRCCQGDLCNRYQESQNGALVPSTKIIPGKNWTK